MTDRSAEKVRIGFWFLKFDPRGALEFSSGDPALPFAIRLLAILLDEAPELDFVFPIGADHLRLVDPLRREYPDTFHPLAAAEGEVAGPPAPVDSPSFWNRLFGVSKPGAGSAPSTTLEALIAETNCDVWIVTSLELQHVASTVLTGAARGRPIATILVTRIDSVDEIALGVLKIVHYLEAPGRSGADSSPFSAWSPTTYRWLDRYRRALGSEALSEPRPPRSGPYRITLFLSIFYSGGVWQATKALVAGLVAVNRRRDELALTLLVHPDQADCDSLVGLAPDLRLGFVDWDIVPHHKVFWQMAEPATAGPTPVEWTWPTRDPEDSSDALFGLVDRIHAPILPRVPCGFLVYDMIQMHVPEAFGAGFWSWYETGMKPSLARAHCVVATSRATLEMAGAEYGFPPERGRLLPVACDVAARFDPIVPDPALVPDGPYFLYVANSAAHKGAIVMLQAYARIKAQMGARAPKLIHCGIGADRFSSANPVGATDPHFAAVRDLVAALGLREGEDLLFLGFVTDSQLAGLYAGCAAVINAARFDNGSYSMIEGHSFGCPLISSDYPAMRELAERFRLPVNYFPVNDAAALALRLAEALAIPRIEGDELAAVREDLRAYEFGFDCYAERMYDVLVELGRAGRGAADEIGAP